MKDRQRVLRRGLAALLVAVLAGIAASCGGDDGGGGGDWQIEGLGSTLDEIRENAREEGQVDLVQWPQYATLVDEFEAATGCQVSTKDAGTGDDMISLIQSGEYDGVSASGHTSVRLMAAGDVAPVNPDLLPNYADVSDGIKLKSYNSRDGEPYGAPHGRGPNLLVFRTDEVTPAPDSWSAVWEDGASYKGKISIYDDSIFIADAALYLKATQPDLEIENPYQLTQ
jgi:putative spermidine/putrescine transport system substrate-binding protein